MNTLEMPCCSATSRRPEISICCAETYLNVALGQAEGEQIEKLQGTKEALATNMWEKEQLQQDRNITALRQQHNTG